LSGILDNNAVLICIQHLTLFFGGHHFAAKTAMQDLMLHHIVDYAELSCGQGAWQ